MQSHQSPEPDLNSTRRRLGRKQSEDVLNTHYRSGKEGKKAPKHGRDPSQMLDFLRPTASHHRLRSTTWSAQNLRKASKSSHYEVPPPLPFPNPAPFHKAIHQAVLRELLDAPHPSPDSVFSAGLRRTKSNASSNSSSTVHASGPITYAAHERKESKHGLKTTSSSHTALTPKLFILTEDGRILQYSTDGMPDRPPEKLLQLGPKSTAIASDAIPGRHWVLSVAQDGRTEHSCSSPALSFKNLRPQMLSKTSEPRRQAQELLLVFDSDYVFNKWLRAVRQAIEALGGMEYRPDSQGITLLGRNRNEPPPQNRDSCHFPSAAFIKSLDQPRGVGMEFGNTIRPDSLVMPSHLNRPPSQKSAANSSVATHTELDRLRDSLTFDGMSQRTGTRSSCAESNYGPNHPPRLPEKLLPNIDPSQAQFEPWKQMSTTNRRQKKIIPQPIFVEPTGRKRSLTCSPALGSPKMPRTPTLAPDAVDGLLGNISLETLRRDETEAAKMTAWLTKVTKASYEAGKSPDQSPDIFAGFDSVSNQPAALEQFPSPPNIKKPVVRQIRANTDTSPRPEHQPQGVTRDSSYSDTAIADFAKKLPLPHAPRRKSSLDFARRTVARLPRSSPARDKSLGLGIRGQEKSATSERRTSLSQARNSLELQHISPQRRNRKFLSINTGRGPPAPSAPSLSPIPSPSLVDSVDTAVEGDHWLGNEKGSGDVGIAQSGELGLALSNEVFGRKVRSPPDQSLPTPASNPRALRSQKSMPNVLCRAGGPPAPPPTGPLPEVPTGKSPAVSSVSSPNLQYDRGKSVSPALTPWGDGYGPGQRPRSITLDPEIGVALSPLSSNPVSPAEFRHARRLSSQDSQSAAGSRRSSTRKSQTTSIRGPFRSPPVSRKSSVRRSPVPSFSNKVHSRGSPTTTPMVSSNPTSGPASPTTFPLRTSSIFKTDSVGSRETRSERVGINANPISPPLRGAVSPNVAAWVASTQPISSIEAERYSFPFAVHHPNNI